MFYNGKKWGSFSFNMFFMVKKLGSFNFNVLFFPKCPLFLESVFGWGMHHIEG